MVGKEREGVGRSWKRQKMAEVRFSSTPERGPERRDGPKCGVKWCEYLLCGVYLTSPKCPAGPSPALSLTRPQSGFVSATAKPQGFLNDGETLPVACPSRVNSRVTHGVSWPRTTSAPCPTVARSLHTAARNQRALHNWHQLALYCTFTLECLLQTVATRWPSLSAVLCMELRRIGCLVEVEISCTLGRAMTHNTPLEAAQHRNEQKGAKGPTSKNLICSLSTENHFHARSPAQIMKSLI